MTEQEAIAASTDKALIAESLADVIEQWAVDYLTKRAARDTA